MNSRSRFVKRPLVLSAALAAVLTVPGLLLAANPQLSRIEPVGARRGVETEIQFGGDRLSDAQQLLFNEPGIDVANIEVVNPTTLKVKLAIAPDCRLGFHAVRIRTATGLSNLRTFSVGALAELAEVEPNNDPEHAQKISLDTTINGIIAGEDADYFMVEAKKGDRISAEVEGMRLGRAYFDPFVAILDMKQKELALSDDAPLVRQDGVCSAVAPEDGSYLIMIRESSFASGNTYRLHIGRFPRPTAVIPGGGRPGQVVEVRWLGDVLGPRTEKITLPAQASLGFGIFAKDASGIAPSAIPFRVVDLENVLEAEPNNTAAEATPFVAPMALGGVLEKPGDIDFFKVALTKGQAFEARVYARQLGSPVDSVLTVARANGATVVTNDDSGGPDSMARFTAAADETYTISIRDHLDHGGVDYAYRIEIAPVKPALTVGLPERVQYNDTILSVPQGNRSAAMVSAKRADFSADLKLEMQNLPPGVTAEILPMPAGRTETAVIFTAAPGAKLDSTLADVVGRSTDEKAPAQGHFLQRTLLIRGQGNAEVWWYSADRMPLALIQEAPYSIEVVQPKVPVVRGGSMELKVIATRKEGFTAPINLRLLYNPPGIGSSTAATIPEGKTEGAIPLTANSDAEAKNWKIVALAEATVGDGPYLVSSGWADLEISDPYLAFTFKAAAVEQGQATEMVVKVEKKKDFTGMAKVELVGLPNEATAEPVEISPDATEIVFQVKTGLKSPAARHKGLLCRAVIIANGEPIAHTLGPGELRIDTPLAKKPAGGKPADKRLSRLEQLRQERQQPAATPAKN